MAFALAFWQGGRAKERAPHLVVLDEPTNHLDLESVATLGEALAGFTGACVVVSHNQAFLAEFCEELWIMDGVPQTGETAKRGEGGAKFGIAGKKKKGVGEGSGAGGTAAESSVRIEKFTDVDESWSADERDVARVEFVETKFLEYKTLLRKRVVKGL